MARINVSGLVGDFFERSARFAGEATEAAAARRAVKMGDGGVSLSNSAANAAGQPNTVPFVGMPGGDKKQVLGSMWPPDNSHANFDIPSGGKGRAAYSAPTATSSKAAPESFSDKPSGPKQKRGSRQSASTKAPPRAPRAPYSAPSATKGAAPWQSPDYKDWGPNNQMVPSTPAGKSALDKKGMFSKLTSQSWFGNAAMGASVGAATGALNPGGNDGMIGGALGGAVVGGLAGGFGGHFMKGVEKTGMGMKISGGKIGFNPAAGQEFSGISQAAALGVVGGLVGGAKSKRFSTVQSNGWAQGTANMHFPGGY